MFCFLQYGSYPGHNTPGKHLNPWAVLPVYKLQKNYHVSTDRLWKSSCSVSSWASEDLLLFRGNQVWLSERHFPKICPLSIAKGVHWYVWEILLKAVEFLFMHRKTKDCNMAGRMRKPAAATDFIGCLYSKVTEKAIPRDLRNTGLRRKKFTHPYC